jgi:hypothetical protein
MLNRLLHVVLLLVWLELGLMLVVIPWSEVWDVNYFLYQYPSLGLVLKSSYLRGAVSGLGLIDVFLALEAFRRRTSPVASRS